MNHSHEKQKPIVGFTCGTFDLIHAGHILMLEEAKGLCDHLIVGLQTDPTIDRPTKNKPIESITERFIKLRSIKYVDSIIPYSTEEDLLNILKMIDIDIRVIGADYIGRDFTGKAYCLERGIQIIHNNREHSLSSSDMRYRVHQAELAKTQ